MALTIQQLVELLMPDEPNYPRLAQLLTAADVPNLTTLASGPDPLLAAKAAYALTLIQSTSAVAASVHLAGSASIEVRLATAAGLHNFAGLAIDPALDQLLGDGDPGVRKHALRSAKGLASPAAIAKIRAIAASDPEPGLRTLASEILRP